MQGILLRLAILTTSLIACLVLAELVARQGLSHVSRKGVSLLGGALDADPEMLVEYTARGRRLVPNADVIIHNHYISGADVDIKTNSIGLRSPEFNPLPKPGTQRILFVGDSIVAQDYLASDKTSAHLLEMYLNQRVSTPVEVINAGLSNFGLEEEVRFVNEIIDRVHPTHILLSFYLNDSRPAWGFSGDLGEKRGWLRKHSIIVETIFRELEVRHWLKEAKVDRFTWIKLVDSLPWRTSPEAFQQIIAAAPYDWGSAWNDSSWSVVEAGISELSQIAKSYGAQLSVVLMPVSYQVYAEYLNDLPQVRMQTLLKSQAIPALSLLPVFRDNNQEELFFDWCHPNDKGNGLMVPAIGDFILPLINSKD